MQKIRWQIAQFFEKRWWQSYLKKKQPESYLAWKHQYWLQFLHELDLPLQHITSPILDVGCGPAGIFMLFENEITALDPLLADYENLAIFKPQLYSQVNFVNVSFENFETDKAFKTIFCLNAINHFQDLKASFQKLGKICAKDGKVIVSVDAHNHLFFRKLFAWLPLDILHPHQYFLEEYLAFLEQENFTIEKKVRMKKDFFFSYWVIVAKKK
jgi:SAM-dependent methyltransferase